MKALPLLLLLPLIALGDEVKPVASTAPTGP
jgi:hypothetical protein